VINDPVRGNWVLLAGGPLGVFLGDQPFEPLRKLSVPVASGVWPRLGEVEVALVLQRLGRRTIGDPMLLELVGALGAFQDNDHGGQAAGYPLSRDARSAILCGRSRILVAGGPLGVFLGDQAFQPLC
jgi:hypothetical protein